jgi:hypothetical protein
MGTDVSRWTAEKIAAVAKTLNSRPRKTLGWRTPRRGIQRASTLCAIGRCCLDPLNSGLRSVVGVRDALTAAEAAPPQRHLEGVDDELRADVVGDRPAHDASAPGVEDDGQVDLARRGRWQPEVEMASESTLRAPARTAFTCVEKSG